jgi:hypothetical protein
MGFWSRECWSLDGDRLRVPEDGRTRVFESRDGGRSFHRLEADRTTTLMRRDIPAEDISRHCEDPRHAVSALTESGAAHLATVCYGVEWILPFEIQERLPRILTKLNGIFLKHGQTSWRNERGVFSFSCKRRYFVQFPANLAFWYGGCSFA